MSYYYYHNGHEWVELAYVWQYDKPQSAADWEQVAEAWAGLPFSPWLDEDMLHTYGVI